MAEKKTVELVIRKDGKIEYIYSPEAQDLTKDLGPRTGRRASNVEFAESLSDAAIKSVINQTHYHDPPPLELAEWRRDHAGEWYADMLPSGGPVAGPFATREEALRWEIQWLREHHLFCAPCHDAQTQGDPCPQPGV